jgi:predicted O-linked N-acetylglucosamine transferase (SPINDLY family)
MSPQFQIMLQKAIQAFQGGNFDSATLILKRILKVDVKNLPALHILGLIKISQSNYKEAANYLASAAKIHPNDASIHYNLAKALADSGNDMDALIHHKKAVTLAPNNPEAWLSYGKTASKMGCHEDALLWYSNALNLNPEYAEASLNAGAALNELRRYEEAITFAERALAIKPGLAGAWSNKGLALKGLQRFNEAIMCIDEAIGLNPNLEWVFGDLIHAKIKICSWHGLGAYLKHMSNRVLKNDRVASPFLFLALSDDILLHRKCSEIYIQSRYSFNPILGDILKRPKSQKIRVGYFSADFHNHATAYLMAELFELHDKSKFELVGFSFGPIANDELRRRIEKSFDQFIEVGQKSDVEIAQLSRDVNIDIAVDLKGFTQDSRMGIFAYRAAPIQVNYLGYPGTTGANYIDYIIADKTLIPLQSQQSYSEKIVYLPNSYQVNDRQRIISEREFTRQELGLPEYGFAFCCFNNNYKILPETFKGWMRILKAVEGSVLWLFQDNSWAVENLKKEAVKQGIAPDRLVFAERFPLPEHLARHRQADLFLDTFPCNAHTTSSDALWAGLPVLTLMGKSFASRVAASLLSAIGLPELVTISQAEYESLAIELAKSPQKLEELKRKLTNNRLKAPLFDTPLFTKNIEAAYIKMYERHQADLGPEHISLT